MWFVSHSQSASSALLQCLSCCWWPVDCLTPLQKWPNIKQAVLPLSVLAVTMVFPEDRLMAKMFNEEMASFYEKYYEDKGVTLIKGDTVTGFEGDGKVEGTLPSACVHACCKA